jgi:hypothetical protein
LRLQDLGDRALPLAVGLITADHGTRIRVEVADRLLQLLDAGHGPRQGGVEQLLVERNGEQLLVALGLVEEEQDAPLRPVAGALLVEVRVGQQLEDVVVEVLAAPSGALVVSDLQVVLPRGQIRFGGLAD